MTHRLLVGPVLVACLLALSACGTADRQPDVDEWSGTREYIAGVEVVQNPASPLLDTGTVVVDSLWAAPSRAAEDRHGIWEDPSAVRVADQAVYVLDRMGRRIYVLDVASGRLERSVSREGGGPGELEEPFGLAIQNEEVVVGDRGKASLERFSMEGDYRGTVRLGEIGFSLYGLGPDGFLVSSLLGREGGWRHVSPDGELTPFPWPNTTRAIPGLTDDCRRISAASATVFRLSCRRIAFQVIHSNGALQREVVVDRSPEPVPEAKIEAHLEEIRTIMRQSGLPARTIESQVEEQRERLQRNPRMRSVRLDRQTGRLAVWEQEPEDLGSGPARVHVFSPEGIYLVQLDFEHPWVDFDWVQQTLYALVRDPRTDLVRLIAYEIDLPAPPQ